MENRAEQLAGFASPFDDLVGTVLDEASAERVVAHVTVDARLHQPGGAVHGGVYATVVETTASIGANLWLEGTAMAVGVSNHTDFLHAVRDGAITATATPLQRGRRLQLWQVAVTDGRDRLVAHGTVKLANLPADGR